MTLILELDSNLTGQTEDMIHLSARDLYIVFFGFDEQYNNIHKRMTNVRYMYYLISEFDMVRDFGIYFDEKKRTFLLQMEKASYVMSIVNDYLGHVYFGKKLGGFPGISILRTEEYSYVKGEAKDKCTFMDAFPFEYSISGTGDFRAAALKVKNSDGFMGGELKYVSHRIYAGKERIEGLPACFGSSEDTASLDIILKDETIGLKVTLKYSIFRELDAVVRSVILENEKSIDETADLYIEKAMSSSFSIEYADHEVITLHGSWARERIADRRIIGHGRTSIGSTRGISSHQEHPFMAIVSPDTGEDSGEVYGMSFIYSGNFLAEADRTQHDELRINMGLAEDGFSWKLEKGEVLNLPEAVLVYSSEGLGEMSRSFHRLFTEHLIRSGYLHKKRPVLINNWEATYFDFNEERLLEIARTAKKAGIEMLVMDDGWFGHRDSDNSSLGDWTVDRKKLPDGIDGLCRKINDIGLEMGIWFEPEMISPDSDLYRQHPDYAVRITGRDPSECRSQFVLDLTRKEVRDCIYDQVYDVLKNSNIRYVKWDMNRPLTDVGSITTRGGEFHHRYMLAVYELQERLINDFPDLLLENCSSGGGRFDPGMLYYSPQIWCSDDTDAIERLAIQEGTALIYPPSVIGAHVSICPNHIVGRTTDLETRGYVALAGTFGYEMDITKLSDEELQTLAEQVKLYHKYNDLVREGELYRISSCSMLYKRNTAGRSYAWMNVATDKSEALLTYVQVRGGANQRSERLLLSGLQADAEYRLSDGRIFRGDELMNVGFVTDKLYGDGKGQLYHFVKVVS